MSNIYENIESYFVYLNQPSQSGMVRVSKGMALSGLRAEL